MTVFCLYCDFCKFPRSPYDNGGACKCKKMKYKTIDVYVSGGQTPTWCPLLSRNSKVKGN